MTRLHVIYNSFPFVVLPQHLFCRNPNRPSIWVSFFIVTSRDRFLPQQKATYIGDSSPNKWHISPIRLLETWSNWFRSMKSFEGNQQKDQGMFFVFFVFFCLQDSLEHWSFRVGFSTTTLVGLYVSGPGRFRVGIQGGNPRFLDDFCCFFFLWVDDGPAGAAFLSFLVGEFESGPCEKNRRGLQGKVAFWKADKNRKWLLYWPVTNGAGNMMTLKWRYTRTHVCTVHIIFLCIQKMWYRIIYLQFYATIMEWGNNKQVLFYYSSWWLWSK